MPSENPSGIPRVYPIGNALVRSKVEDLLDNGLALADDFGDIGGHLALDPRAL